MSVPSPTWYDLLGVEPTADSDEIRSAWRDGIADLDPTERRFATLNEAAAVLLDPARRSAYDEELRAAEPEPEPEPTDSELVEETAEPARSASTGSADVAPDMGLTHERPRKAPYLVPGWVLATVAVVALAAVVLAAVLGARSPADKVIQADAQLAGGSKVTQIEEPAQDAMAAAKEAITPVLSYDYRKLTADRAAAGAVMTPAYRAKYDKIFDDVVAKQAPGLQAVVKVSKVVEAGIVRVDDDRVQVLVLVDRSTARKSSATPLPTQDQVTLTMQKVGGRWLVDDLRTTPIAD